MGKEYKILIEELSVSFSDLGVESIYSYWKKESKYGNHYIGRIPDSDWPELMIWKKNGSLGVTLYGSSASTAWQQFRETIRDLKIKNPNLKIVDWDSEEDMTEDFFSD